MYLIFPRARARTAIQWSWKARPTSSGKGKAKSRSSRENMDAAPVMVLAAMSVKVLRVGTIVTDDADPVRKGLSLDRIHLASKQVRPRVVRCHAYGDPGQALHVLRWEGVGECAALEHGTKAMLLVAPAAQV